MEYYILLFFTSIEDCLRKYFLMYHNGNVSWGNNNICCYRKRRLNYSLTKVNNNLLCFVVEMVWNLKMYAPTYNVIKYHSKLWYIHIMEFSLTYMLCMLYNLSHALFNRNAEHCISATSNNIHMYIGIEFIWRFHYWVSC